MNSTNSLRRMTLLYACVALGLTPILTVLRCLNFLFFFDADIGYYSRGAALPIISAVLGAVAILACGVGAILWFRKKPISYPAKPSLAVRIAAVIAALGFLVYTLTGLMPLSDGQSRSYLAVLCGLAAAVYFVLMACNRQKDSITVLTGFGAIVALVLALAGSYFNILVQMNAPDKLVFQLGCLAGMLFLVSEIRAIVSETRPALYLFATATGTILLGSASIPSIIAYHMGLLPNTDSLGGYYMLLGLFVYVAVRLVTLCIRPQPAPVPVSEESADEEDVAETAEPLPEEEPIAEEAASVEKTEADEPDRESANETEPEKTTTETNEAEEQT